MDSKGLEETKEEKEGKEIECCFSEQRKKHRELAEYKELLNRLSRIEGQVRGVRKMVEEECYCIDILTQVSAIQSALNGFSRKLTENHIKTCVVREIKEGREKEAVEELLVTLQRLLK